MVIRMMMMMIRTERNEAAEPLKQSEAAEPLKQSEVA